MNTIIFDGLIDGSIIFLFGLATIKPIARIFKFPASNAFLLYTWHSFFTVFYVSFAHILGADALNYYANVQSADFSWQFGSGMVVALAYPFGNILNLSMLAVCLLFGIAGAIGLIIFASVLRICVQYKSKLVRQLAYLTPFLPSLSFWSSSIGKDSIAFLAVALFVWAALADAKRRRYLVVGITLMILVRPHIALLFFIGIIAAEFFGGYRDIVARFLFVSVGSVVIGFIIPTVFEYVGINNDAVLSDVSEFISHRQQLNSLGGSSFDLASMSPFMRIFTYLFRPTIIEVHTPLALISSIENMLLLLGFYFAVIKSIFFRQTYNSALRRTPLIIYAFLALFFLSQTTANLGIAARQKWMIMPPLIAIAFASIPARREASYRIPSATSPSLLVRRNDGSKM